MANASEPSLRAWASPVHFVFEPHAKPCTAVDGAPTDTPSMFRECNERLITLLVFVEAVIIISNHVKISFMPVLSRALIHQTYLLE